MSDFPTPGGTPPGPGWWLASDGNWYPPEQAPGSAPPPPPPYGGSGYGYPTVVAPRPSGNNGYAIASLIVSILFCTVGSFLGVIFGHIALHQIRQTGEDGRGLAVAGLVIGYIGILAMIVIVIALFAYGQGDTDLQFDSIVRSWT